MASYTKLQIKRSKETRLGEFFYVHVDGKVIGFLWDCPYGIRQTRMWCTSEHGSIVFATMRQAIRALLARAGLINTRGERGPFAPAG